MFDAALLRDFEDAPADPFEPPFLSRFAKGALRLDYVATLHGVGLSHPTFKTIDAAFALGGPAALVIEGLPDASGVSPASYIEYARRHEAEGFAHEGELPYAALLAHRRGIPFRGGEPTDMEAAGHLERAGWTRRDYVFFDAARWIPVWRGQGTLDPARLRERVEDTMGSLARRVGAGEPPAFAEWEEWCRRETGRAPLELEPVDAGPFRRGTPAQRLSAVLNLARDARCLKVAGEELARHAKVLVVYGCSHLNIQRPALEAALGPSEDAKLF